MRVILRSFLLSASGFLYFVWARSFRRYSVRFRCLFSLFLVRYFIFAAHCIHFCLSVCSSETINGNVQNNKSITIFAIIIPLQTQWLLENAAPMDLDSRRCRACERVRGKANVVRWCWVVDWYSLWYATSDRQVNVKRRYFFFFTFAYREIQVTVVAILGLGCHGVGRARVLVEGTASDQPLICDVGMTGCDIR